MGVFNITPRSEVIQPSLIRSPVRRYQGQTHYVADSSAQWRGAERLGRGITDLATAMMRIGADMARERNMIQDNETEAAFVDATRAKMDAPESGLLQRVATAGNSDTLQGCVEESEGYFKSAAEDLLREKGYFGDRKKRMMMRLREAASPFQRTMAQGVLKKTTELKVSAADKDFNSLLETWRSRMTDEDSTRSVIDSFRASQRVRGLADDAVETNTEKIWQSMAYDYVTKNVGAANRQQLDWLEEHVQGGHGGDLFAFNPVLGEHFGGKDPLGHSVSRRNGGAVSARDGVKAAILMRRHELDQQDEKTVDMAANLGTVSVAAIRDKDGRYPSDRLPNIEQSIETLTKLSKTLPQGGHAATDAATRASDLNAKADMIAQQEMIDSYLEDLRKDPEAKIYIGETKDAKGGVAAKEQNSYFGQGRKERLAPLVQQLVDQQRGQPASQMRKQRVAELKMRMLSGARSPGDYHNEVFKAAKDGEIGLSDYQALVKEFDESWATGFEAGKKSPKQMLAEGMLGIVQEFFPSTALGSAYEWDDKTATMKLKKDTDYEGLEYEVFNRTNIAKEAARGYGFFAPAVEKYKNLDPTGILSGIGTAGNALFLASMVPTHTTHKIDPAGVGKIVNTATALSFYDGKQIDFDPITGGDTDFFTGEKIKTGKDAPVFNAANYFRKYMQRLADVNKATGAAEEIMRLVEAERHVSGAFGDQEEKRTSAIAEAARTRQPSVVQIRNRKSGEGVTTKR